MDHSWFGLTIEFDEDWMLSYLEAHPEFPPTPESCMPRTPCTSPVPIGRSIQRYHQDLALHYQQVIGFSTPNLPETPTPTPSSSSPTTTTSPHIHHRRGHPLPYRLDFSGLPPIGGDFGVFLSLSSRPHPSLSGTEVNTQNGHPNGNGNTNGNGNGNVNVNGNGIENPNGHPDGNPMPNGTPTPNVPTTPPHQTTPPSFSSLISHYDHAGIFARPRLCERRFNELWPEIEGDRKAALRIDLKGLGFRFGERGDATEEEWRRGGAGLRRIGGGWRGRGGPRYGDVDGDDVF
ncbi:hypothetical protein MMC24_001682 [Lignoscripta atroalba]|nr:hypothetical protein [Lignoscripta atroalba]